MTWTDVSGSSGDVVTAEIWNQLYANFAALAAGDSGAPAVAVEGALSSTGTLGYALVVGAGGAITTAAVIPAASGSVVDDGLDTGSITIPVTLNTAAGSIYRWSVAKTTDLANYTLEYATGYLFRYVPTVGGTPPPDTWAGEVTHQLGDNGGGAGSLPTVTITVNGSNQMVINVATDMDGDTYTYTLETVR